MRNEFLVCNFQSKVLLLLGILTFKGSLLSEALVLKRFFARNLLNPDFCGSKFGGFLDRRPPYSKFEGTCINRNTTFPGREVEESIFLLESKRPI